MTFLTNVYNVYSIVMMPAQHSCASRPPRGAAIREPAHLKMYYAQGYNHKKIINFSSKCHCCQFDALWEACEEQDYTSNSYVA